MHVRWVDIPTDTEAVEVDLRVIEPPKTPHLHFWALQASFIDGKLGLGAGHLGLQWISGHPGSTAVNWGGYHEGGDELEGTESHLHSGRANVNTRDFSWRPERLYRLRIDRGAAGWRGSVIDLETDRTTVVRELLCEGQSLRHIVMWSEVFAPCDGPSTAVEWSRARAIGPSGSHNPRFSISYQSLADGGCSNTDSSIDAESGSVVQRTNTPRTNHP